MSDTPKTAPTAELGPRSRLLSAFFDRLNQEDIAYAVMNNYEELPWVIPSDVDFTIPPALFARLDDFVLDFAKDQGALVVQKLWHGNLKCAYIVAIGPEGAREFVQLDFFVAFSTKGCPALIPHEDLVAGRRMLRNFQVPRPEVELLFTAMRRFFKDDWSDRHCARIAELDAKISDKDWVPARYRWIQPTLDAAIQGDLTTVNSRRAQDWAQLRQASKGNLTLPETIANAALQTRRIGVRLRDETGYLALVTGPTEHINDSALEILELVFHRRMFIGEEMLAGLGAKARLAFPAQLALLKRRKGLIFLQAGPDSPKGRKLAKMLDRFGLVDQVLSVGADAAPQGIKAPVTQVASVSEVIEAIIARQAAKTARAITRGGTQTSG